MATPKTIQIIKKPLTKTTSAFLTKEQIESRNQPTITIQKQVLTTSNAFLDPNDEATKKAKIDKASVVLTMASIPSVRDLNFPASSRALPTINSSDDPYRVFVIVLKNRGVDLVRCSNQGALASRIAMEEERHEDARWCQTVSFCRGYVTTLFYDKENLEAGTTQTLYARTIGSQERFEQFMSDCQTQIRSCNANKLACERVLSSLKIFVNALVDPKEEMRATLMKNDYAARVAYDMMYLPYLSPSRILANNRFEGLLDEVSSTQERYDKEIKTRSDHPTVPPKDVETYCYGPNPGSNDLDDIKEYLKTCGKGRSMMTRLGKFMLVKQNFFTLGAKRIAERYMEMARYMIYSEMNEVFPKISYYGYVVPGEYVAGLAPLHRYLPTVGDKAEDPSDNVSKSLLNMLGAKRKAYEMDEELKNEGIDFFAMPGSPSNTAGMGMPIEQMIPSLWLDFINGYLGRLPRNRGGGKGLTLSELPWFRSLKIRVFREYAENRIPLLPAKPLAVLNFLNWLPDPMHVRVVLMGQDCYPNPLHACGVAFSAPHPSEGTSENEVPASLRVIFNAAKTKLEKKPGWLSEETKRDVGCLKRWCDQGILLPNVSLNVVASSYDPEENPDIPFCSHSRQDMGWFNFIALMVEALGNREDGNVIFLAYGEEAKTLLQKCSFSKGDRLLANTTRVLFNKHPSPRVGDVVYFEENAGFEEVNQFLLRRKQKPIQW